MVQLNYHHQGDYKLIAKTAKKRHIAVSFSNRGARSLIMTVKPNNVGVN
jgi:hypothetical protein